MKHVLTFHRPFWIDSEIMLAVWERSWRSWGWTPVVLGESDAARHPKYRAINQKVDGLPCINPPFFQRSCFIRWGAVASFMRRFAVEPAVFVDYDVLNYGWTPKDCPAGFANLGKNHETELPGMGFVGTSDDFDGIVRRLLDHRLDPQIDEHKGRPHCGDSLILCHARRRDFPRYLGVETVYLQPGWETSILVHYGAGKVPPESYSKAAYAAKARTGWFKS